MQEIFDSYVENLFAEEKQVQSTTKNGVFFIKSIDE